MPCGARATPGSGAPPSWCARIRWNKQPWERLDARRLSTFRVWPRDTAVSFNRDGRRDYFDSMYHAGAVVGLNTSGQVEAGLLGRPVLTLLAPDVPSTLRRTVDTLHFQHLLGFNGGLLHVGRSFAEHEEQLARAFSGDPTMAERSRRFSAAFVRPHGIDRPATPSLVEAIRSLRQTAAADRRPRRAGAAAASAAPTAERSRPGREAKATSRSTRPNSTELTGDHPGREGVRCGASRC
jgi:hypothetical protein